MDRRSFIIQQNRDPAINTNECGLENCECEVSEEKNKEEEGIRISQLLFLALLALICALLIPVVRNGANGFVVADIVNRQKENAISCQPLNSSNHIVKGNHLPPGNNNRNCAHQSGNGCLCESRRRLKLMS